MNLVVPLLFVAAAVVGALSRWWLTRFNDQAIPVGTLAVNIAASFAAGVASNVSPTVAVIVVTGYLGSTSTFSTLVGELVDRWIGGLRVVAVAYGVITTVVGVGAAAIGLTVGG